MIDRKFFIFVVGNSQFFIGTNFSFYNMRRIDEGMTSFNIIFLMKQGTKRANTNFRKLFKMNNRPTLFISNRVSKHLNKTSFNELVELGELKPSPMYKFIYCVKDF